MKTSEKYVVAKIEVDGRVYERKFRVATDDGELMTRRLKRLLSGGVSHYYDQEHRETVYFHFIGMVWRPPYRLLHEVIEDRLLLQTELAGTAAERSMDAAIELDGLLRELPSAVPKKAMNDKITVLLHRELDLRHRLSAKIRELKRRDDTRVPRPYENSLDSNTVD